MEHIVETYYPLSFRNEEAKKLGNYLKARMSVVIIGMKRVGIANFLRFFVYHSDIKKEYLDDREHFFIPVDLNDLVEREIYPFWVLTLKRIEDTIQKSELPAKVKKQVEVYFLDSIQSHDLFMTIDSVRKSLILLTETGFLPTIFYLRFDRMKDAATPEFFNNIEGLVDATHQKLAFVFTSDRRLSDLAPKVFRKEQMSAFSDNLYFKPGDKENAKVVYEGIEKNINQKLPENLKNKLMEYVDGYVQYLQFALISIHEFKKLPDASKLFETLANDERIVLQSEELWESLDPEEQKILIKVVKIEKLTDNDLKTGEYLIKTGFFNPGSHEIFSPIFEEYIKNKSKEKKISGKTPDLSKKENALLLFLEQNKDQICEREQIISAVWPESEEMGVSDWAIDRLVARLRNKLILQKSKYQIVTVKTRGYKLTE